MGLKKPFLLKVQDADIFFKFLILIIYRVNKVKIVSFLDMFSKLSRDAINRPPLTSTPLNSLKFRKKMLIMKNHLLHKKGSFLNR